MMRARLRSVSVGALVLFLAGCGSSSSPAGKPGIVRSVAAVKGGKAYSDLEKVRAADFSILFIGNSHTTMHNLPDIVGRMISHLCPGKTAYTSAVQLIFL